MYVENLWKTVFVRHDEEIIGKVLSLCVQFGSDWLCLKPKASPYHNCSKVLCA